MLQRSFQWAGCCFLKVQSGIVWHSNQGQDWCRKSLEGFRGGWNQTIVWDDSLNFWSNSAASLLLVSEVSGKRELNWDWLKQHGLMLDRNMLFQCICRAGIVMLQWAKGVIGTFFVQEYLTLWYLSRRKKMVCAPYTSTQTTALLIPLTHNKPTWL